MRHCLFGLAAIAIVAGSANAQTYVHGYVTKSGTYVAPHYRSSPDSRTTNNWSVKPNVNPYTGKVGTKSLYGSSYGSPYGSQSSSSCSYCSSSSSTSSSNDDDQ